ncbi:MAG TPA: cellulase family glycosylhydrolase [Candidatus Baltobacteraceae bacterium]|nr:cellulase family glycosylhydrolase [Candidatus Baltobacteraceae bacterium]
MSAFLLGVNYWPRRSAMYMWERFDLGEIREDLARIKDFGLDLVRFFLRWDDFQPAPDSMDKDMLRRFDAMMHAIADAGLRAMPTLFCGHMSGVNWLPAWSLDPGTPHGRFRTIVRGTSSPYGIGDFYHDPKLIDAQERFALAVGERVRDHPSLYAWDLGNEFSNMREPRQPEDAAQWSARLTQALAESSGGAVTAGTHGEDVERDRHLRPSSLAAPWPLATMHGYSVYATFSTGRLDTDVVPFYAALIQSFTGKPLLFTEFGNPECPPGANTVGGHACLNEDEMSTYAQGVLERLHAQGAIGAMWWCWSDYDLSLADQPPFDLAPHELRFGMIRADGGEKPVARVLARFAAERRTVSATPPPIADEAEFYASLPAGIDALYRRYRG